MPNEEIDEGQNTIGRQASILEQVEKTGATFLITDLDLAMTLTRIASDAAEDSEKRDRNRANARRAYDTVSQISDHASLAVEDRKFVYEKLLELRSALEQLGETFAQSSQPPRESNRSLVQGCGQGPEADNRK